MRPVDGDKLMMHLTDWWYASFGQEETDDSKAIKTVIDKIEQTLGEFALEKQDRWIPVTERLPEKEGCYLVTVKNDHERRYSKTAWYSGDGWFARQDIIAWRLTPEPYTEKKNHDKQRKTGTNVK